VRQHPLQIQPPTTATADPAAVAGAAAARSAPKPRPASPPPAPPPAAEPESPVVPASNTIEDLGVKRDRDAGRRRRLFDRPVRSRTERESEFTGIGKGKLAEPGKYEKPRPVTPQHKQITVESGVRGPVSSRHPAPRRNLLGAAAPAPVLDTEGQEDDIALPPSTAGIEIPQPVGRRRRGGDVFELMFGGARRRDDDSDPPAAAPETNGFPLLRNLERFWQQDVVFPGLPFPCGNPNTAKTRGFLFTDRDARDVAPCVTPVVLVNKRSGIDLVRKFRHRIFVARRPA